MFRAEAEVWHLHLSNGEVIRTTAEHPFWAAGPGREQGAWTAAKDLRPGDRLRSLSGAEVTVQEVYFSGETEPVYNARVGEHHTYFVRSPGATEFVWAHNACAAEVLKASKAAGKAAEAAALVRLTAWAVRVVGRQVTAITSKGRRVIDFVVLHQGKLMAIEVKAGNAMRKVSQRVKDLEMLEKGTELVGKNIPREFRGRVPHLPTMLMYP